jgi:DNA-binding transcriptional regulator YhcF (GntR family)
MKVNERKPSYRELAKLTKLSLKTISRHIQDLNFNDYVSDLRVLTPNVLMALYKRAKDGKAAEVKLWMEIVENWKELTNVNHEGRIQIEKINFVMDDEQH